MRESESLKRSEVAEFRGYVTGEILGRESELGDSVAGAGDSGPAARRGD